MFKEEERLIASDGIARVVSCSSLTIKGFRQRLFPRSAERGPIEAAMWTPGRDAKDRPLAISE